MTKKILIIDNDVSLLAKLKININEFEVETTSTVEDAISLIENGNFSFIVADIKLDKGKLGYSVFDKLFFKGRYVPGIVITAYELTDGQEEELQKLGVEKLEKVGVKGTLSSRIQSRANEILNDRRKKYAGIIKKIEEYGLENSNASHNGKTRTINSWMKIILNDSMSIEEEENTINSIITISNVLIKRNNTKDYDFPQI
ncbi:MAG: response regulator [Nitrosarchaeum sp.]|nr:MAG: response regulator [Nitrosarchaeum sp.]